MKRNWSIMSQECPRAGSYEGMPQSRVFDVRMHAAAAPRSVHLNGEPLAADAWVYCQGERTVELSVSEGPARTRPAVVRCVWD